MKKLLFAVPVILFMAAGCNSSSPQPTTEQIPPVQQTQNAQNQQQVAQNLTAAPTPTPTPTPAALGPMPKMTYKLVSSTDTPLDGGGITITSVLDLYANGNKVGTVTTGDYSEGSSVDFFAGNSEEVLFSVLLNGIGDNTVGDPDIYKLDLQNGTVTSLTQNNSSPAIDYTSDLKYIAYASANTSTKGTQTAYALHFLNTDTQSDEVIELPGVPVSLQGQHPYAGDVKISPDQTKVAVVQDYYGTDGPVMDAGTIFIVNLPDKTVTTYQQSDTKPLQIVGWKNNIDVDWSYSQ